MHILHSRISSSLVDAINIDCTYAFIVADGHGRSPRLRKNNELMTTFAALICDISALVLIAQSAP